jgi:hypothetical protein
VPVVEAVGAGSAAWSRPAETSIHARANTMADRALRFGSFFMVEKGSVRFAACLKGLFSSLNQDRRQSHRNAKP